MFFNHRIIWLRQIRPRMMTLAAIIVICVADM
jgi:hypothetical protein